ncbi:MAG: HAD family phosphatase [Bacteroidetes bacterium]|nr:HAD family phosphatase [Bacteroidota bacterium]
MEPKKIETIIFDLGGVLIDWNPEYVYRTIFDDEKEMNYFLTEICNPDWNVEQDAGRSLEVATQLLVDEFPDYETEIRAFYGRWEEMLGGPIEESVQILKQLHRQNRHRLYALTNWSHETFPVALRKYDFLQLFKGIVVSGEEKMKKPESRIYQTTLDRYGIDPSTAVFIDDSEKNVEGARSAGIHGIHFQSPAQLNEALKMLNIKVE